MNEYLDLYSAIWKQAIDDDINRVVKELTIHGFNSAYEFFALNYLEKNADKIFHFNDYESTISCIKVIEELQEIKIVAACNSLAIYKTENETYIIIIDKTIYIIKNKDNYIAKNDERFKKFKSELSEYCRIRTREVEKRIRELVYKESQEWPHNKNYKVRDEEYNTKLQSLTLEVSEYAKEKMKKCWYKL